MVKDNAVKAFGFSMPGYSLQGPDCSKELPQIVRSFHAHRPMIVTDKDMLKLGFIEQINDHLRQHKCNPVIFDEVVPNPTDENVYSGVEFYKKRGCDLLISFGGGSAHDCAKGIGLIINNGGKISDYAGVDKLIHRLPPLIAINTTAGTASEMTKFAVITDTTKPHHLKMTLVDWRLTPRISINDPVFMLGLPPFVTAISGMDALTHAIEAFVSTTVNHITDTCALKSCLLIADALPKAVKNGQDMQARHDMAYAQYLAGMAFNTAGLGLVHAMAHQLGGLYDLPHGLCNTLLLPHVMDFNLPYRTERFRVIAIKLGADVSSMPQRFAGKRAVEAVHQLTLDIGLEPGLAKHGVKEEDLLELATLASNDAIGRTNPKQPTVDQIIEIYRAAL